MKTIKVKVYQYDELNETAKEKARSWFLEGVFTFDWYDHIYEDAKTTGFEITSFDIYRQDIEGEIKTSCEDIAKAIVTNHGKTCETYKDAKNYLKELKALGSVPDLMPGHNQMAEDVHQGLCDEWDAKKEELDGEFFKTILSDYLFMLKKESEYIQSAEYLEEGIKANEYTFTNDGKRFG